MSNLAVHSGNPPDGRRLRLTKNDRLVLAALEDAGAPLKAYDLLERLKVQGIGAPMTVYRALDRLQKQGLVHKLDGLGAFVVCQHGAPHEVESFLVCRKCEDAEELDLHNDALRQLITDALGDREFDTDRIRLEIRGICKRCNLQ